MHVRRRTGLLVALLSAGAVILPLPTAAQEHQAQLRGGLSGVVRGHRAGLARIESRSLAGTRQIAVSIDVGGEPDERLRSMLHEAGMAVRGSWRTTIEGYIAPARLGELARVGGVRSISPIRRSISTFVGPAPAIHGATGWQQAGYTGTGVKVGILDGGFDGFAGLMGSELPATVQTRCYAQLGIATSNLADCVTPGDTHGTAVAESIVDMAPGASLYISNAHSRADLAAAIRWMTASGVRVINFSRAYLLDGMGDGTSPYSNSVYGLVDLAVSGGALFVASAGNSAETTWVGPAADADSNGWIEFAPGADGNSLDLAAGDDLAVGIRWVGAASDYDFSIWQGGVQIAESADAQTVTGDPLETIEFTAPSAGTYTFRIWHRGGPAAPSIRLMVLTSADTGLTYRTTAGSLPSPADSRNPGLITVGAVDYRSPGFVEPYSSQGPTLDGRTKPDLVAVDCAPTMIESVFCGTSESAPFVTGAAALLLQDDPARTPAQLAGDLRSHTTPIGAPVPNSATGFGLLALGGLPATAPASLAFLAPAATGAAGTPFLGQPVVGVMDASGQLVTRGLGLTLPVTLSIATNAGSGTLACPAGLTGVAAGGIVRFSGCAIDAPGSGYVLRADAPGLVAAVGAPFAVAPAGSPPALTLAASVATITYGASLGLTGRAALPGGAGLAIDAEQGTGGVYGRPATTTTDVSGLAGWTVKPITTSDFRLRTVAPGTGLVDVSPPVRIRVNAKATLGSSIATGRTITRTTRLTLTTTIRPIGTLIARGRARFDVLQRTSAGWTRRSTVYANADATGRGRVTIRLPSAGSWWIRSRAEPTATNGASTWTTGVRYTVSR